MGCWPNLYAVVEFESRCIICHGFVMTPGYVTASNEMGGQPIELRLRGKDLHQMKQAVTDLKVWFAQFQGVVVNDSILLVIFLKQAGEEGMSIHTAAARASRERFRAVILTSSTTIAGLLPLLFEKSLQAQILIPLVVSVTFGLMASTVMVLLVIPCMYLIMGNLGLVEKYPDPVQADHTASVIFVPGDPGSDEN